MSECICEPITNIYRVEYKLAIDIELHHALYQERARCIAYDTFMAMLLVNDWLETTPTIWRHDEEILLDGGDRDITIIKTELYTPDVGAFLKQCPLPTIFPED
jgi:hypothetical protein